VNFFGHAVVAVDERGGRASPTFVLGAMLPDLCGMARLSAPQPADEELAAGVALHHVTDAAFHGARRFLGLSADAQAELQAAGLSHGSAMAVAHVGVELLLDGILSARLDAATTYREALSIPCPPIRWRQVDHAERFEQLRRRLSVAPVPAAYADPIFVAARVCDVLARRPRLALDAGGPAVVRRWAVPARGRVIAAAPALLAEVAGRMPASRAAWATGSW
jgi:hypothetical protein